jgi:putative secretion ATPase (PEP-CTERM system associated)
MYEKYFQLRERPFALSPDPDYLYPSKVHQEALSYLRYGIEGHAGFVVITGEIGSGKTTMLQSLLGRLDRNTTVARVVNTMLDARELLDAIMLDFGLDPTGMSKPVLLHKLAEFLVQQRQAGRLTLLVIDEAQNLSLPALEEIRMLSNLETEKSKLIQIVMIGQPELREKLALPQLEQLRQRITVSYHLQPLDADETANYINHRLKRAAIGAPIEFPREVTNLVHGRSRGVPRIINVIADATLLFAYGIDRRSVDLEVTREALTELDATGVLASYQREGTAAATATSVSVAETQEAIRVADEMRKREQAIAARERQLAQREQALAAQQRVVEEEARLLAAARAARTAAAASAPAVAATAAIAAAPATVLAPASIATSAADAATVGTPARPGTPADEARITPVTESRMVALAPSIATPTAMPAAVTAGPVAASVAASAALTGDVRTVSAIRPGSPRFNSISPSAYVTPSGVRVQRYEQPVPVQPSGFWDRVRRVLFGVTEPETGA